jgi:hypothetical protein
VTQPIQVPTIGEPELPAETVTERALEEIIQGSRVIHARHQGFTKAMARKLLDVMQENAKLREALKASEWQRITPNNLPKVGDEMFCAGREGDGDWITEFDGSISEFGQHWTHFRPINAPKDASK